MLSYVRGGNSDLATAPLTANRGVSSPALT